MMLEKVQPKKLLQRKTLSSENYQSAKWISAKGKDSNYKDLGKDRTHTIKINAKPGTKDWLESKKIDYESYTGKGIEKKFGNVVFQKRNEECSYGIGYDLLDEFNDDWVDSITVSPIDTGKNKKKKRRR